MAGRLSMVTYGNTRCMHMRACVCVRGHACVCVCARAHARVCVRVCVYVCV